MSTAAPPSLTPPSPGAQRCRRAAAETPDGPSRAAATASAPPPPGRPPRPRHRRLAPLLVLLAPVALTVLPGLAGGSPEADLPPAPEGFVLDGDPENGREVFVDVCAICHGDQGAGDGKLSGSLEPPPGNLQERVDDLSDWHLYKVIEEGGTVVGKSPVMVGFGGRLDETSLLDVATYARSLGELDE